jgi:alkylation response protein AidB-like acyl-CoA dehydrogenase
MEFNFTEDQRLLQETVRDFLTGECPVDFVREQWTSETGRSPAFWSKFAEIGVPGLLIPEDQGGLGMDETDLVLVMVEVGRAALAEPVVATAAVAAPLIRDCGHAGLAATWLPRIAEGSALVAVGQPASPLVPEAAVADLLILRSGDGLYAVPAADAQITPQKSNDPSQRLATVAFDPNPEQQIAQGAEADRLESMALDRGALACAAQQLGVGDQLVKMSVEYTSERKQFGVPIGSFQAVKHQVANVQVMLEYARSHVERAAWSVAHDTPCRAVDVSMAKIAAGEAALQGADTSLQVHGALGYTWEQDLHVWMRRAWTLDLAWGETAWHRDRLQSALFDAALPAESFGFTPRDAA